MKGKPLNLLIRESYNLGSDNDQVRNYFYFIPM